MHTLLAAGIITAMVIGAVLFILAMRHEPPGRDREGEQDAAKHAKTLAA